MIVSGEKRDEYRRITRYWEKRFNTAFGVPVAKAILTGKQSVVCFRNGYTKDSPRILARVTLNYGPGVPEWGAEPGENYFKLHINDFVWEVKPKDLK